MDVNIRGTSIGHTSAMPSKKPKRIIVAVNPSASFGATRATGPALVSTLRGLGHDVTMLIEPDYEQLIATAKAAVASKPDAFVVVGGDGMVNLGTNLVAGTKVPLGIVPSGTGNDMARALNIPVGNLEQAVAALDEALTRAPRVIDAGLATDAEGNQRWFGCMVSAGFDAVVNERANRMHHPKGKSRYTIALLLELVSLRPIPYTITMDGERLVTRGMLVSVGNGQSLGGGMRVTPDAIVDDGLLDVLVVRPLSRIQFMRIFPKVYQGTHVLDPRVSVTKVRKVRLESGDDVVAYTDGERFAQLPIDIEVRPGALRVLCPAVTAADPR
ncbi:MAG: YegS/Rv2252/BmrU family lipid kinase [Glaciihabitans sp.]|nr:YegS/Rv2252/BmrU family lipid kinase [Glaciihabitans sp.]